MADVHRPRSILLTGGAGFIGSNLVHHLIASDPELRLVNLDVMTYAADRGHLEGLADPSRHVLVEGDIADRELVDRLLREHDVDTIVHLAAESHVDRSITGPAAFVQSNIVGTYTLLEAARAWWLDAGGAAGRTRRFHHVSTDEVYGDLGPEDPPFTEDTPYRPSSPYSASKAASDHLVRAWARTYGLPVTLSNCSNNYGPRQHPEKLIPVVIRSCVERRPIPVYGKGENVRDWLHVADHCTAIDAIVRRGEQGETYLVGADNERKNLDLVRILCRVVAEEIGAPTEEILGLISFVTDRPGHDRRYGVDGSKTRALGWSAARSFDEGLRETVRWYLPRFA
ncbi:MAG: dTDP-glucose 4,6-dehydratase [Alphaproteobacteria bacterium]|nr:dTDP-glucose 4,6-dehydratase [Alphaproteobacteria bacterium]MCB9697324.1 dTDP-glucose 4,6-dehydratase [Alphaproteobacteria bacterium]